MAGTGPVRAVVRRVIAHAPSLVLASLAAGVAYLLAGAVFGAENAFFAPIAAVVCVSIAGGERLRRGLEIVAGVLVGLVVAELLLRVVGAGPWQLALAVLAAMTLAVGVRAGALISNQAAVAAVLVMSLAPTLGDHPAVRLGDAVIGAVVGLACVAVFAPDPRRAVRRALDAVVLGLVGALRDLAGALRDGDLEAAEAALGAMTQVRHDLDDLDRSLDAAQETVRLALHRRRHGTTLDAVLLVRQRVEAMLGSVRGVARTTANVVRQEARVPDGADAPLDALADALQALAWWAEEDGSDAEHPREAALEAACLTVPLVAGAGGPTTHALVAQVRSAVVDVLRATGLDQRAAVGRVEERAGPLDRSSARPRPGSPTRPHERGKAPGASAGRSTHPGTTPHPTETEDVMPDQTTPQDPTAQQPDPEQPADDIDPPGRTGEMSQEPDHGESTYEGAGRLEGKRALVTGGDSGIGRAVAIAFAREGADVALSYLPEEEDDARTTGRWVEEAGRRALLLPGDIQEEAVCRQLVTDTVDGLGGLDVLINNAAYQMAQDDGLLGITTEQLDRVLRTNVYALFWITQAAVPHLPRGGSIINTTSIQASDPSPPLLDYAATKAAIVNFTQGLAQQLAPQGVRVNAVAPGPIWTPLIPATMPDEKVEQFGADTPLGRAGQPAELAPAYVFLASQESSYITGETIAVTGGRLL